MPPPTVYLLDPFVVQELVEAALAEDRADLDVTTQSLSGWLRNGQARIRAREAGVLCGVGFAEAAFRAVSARGLSFRSERRDGSRVRRGETIATVKGRLVDLLRAERVALNFLQRLSGTATLTAAAVAAAESGGRAQILDTRKTTPGLRAAERYAVRCGGGLNHRDSLAGGVLVKDNHIAGVKAAGGTLHDAVRTVLQAVGPATAVEVEVTNLEEAREALGAGARSLLLDNFKLDDYPPVVELARRHLATLEASGGIRLDTVERISASGVDFISLGALTHSAPAMDIAMDVSAEAPRAGGSGRQRGRGNREEQAPSEEPAPTPPEQSEPTEQTAAVAAETAEEPTAAATAAISDDAAATAPQSPAES